MAQVLRSNYLLILGCIGASLWTWSLLPNSPSFVEQNLVFSYNNLQAGRLWTLVTALFVHGSPIHLLGNMIFLFVFGNTLEKTIGSHAHMVVFFTGGLTAFLLSIPFFPADTGMIEASAAIFTLAAAVMLTRPLKFSWLFLAPQGLIAIVYFMYNAFAVANPGLLGQSYDPSVAYVAHIIGFVTGIPFGIAFAKQWKKNALITLGLLGAYLAILFVISLFFGSQTGTPILGMLGL